MSRANAQKPVAILRGVPWRWALIPWATFAMLVYILWMGQRQAWSNQVDAHWFFLGPWWTNTSFKFLALSILFGGVFFYGGERLRRWMPAVLAVLLAGGQVLFALTARGVLRGTIPWGFDHPSFMFRINEFGDLFPRALGGYSPWWNAGIEHFVGVTSGAHGYGVLLLPLLKIWDPHVFYGAALVFWFIFAFPWLGVASLRAAGVRWEGALCGGLILCGVSRMFFLWLWHFGTVGAMTSAMMALPVVALGYRLAVLRRGGWGSVLGLGLAAWLMCLWTPGVFIGAGLGLGWLWNARRWTWASNRRIFAAGLLALALLSPWLWITWFPCRNVVEYVGTVMERPPMSAMLITGAQRLRTGVQEWHPVLTILGLFGAFLLAPRGARRWVLPGLVVLGVIAGWSREWKPLSQLERMVIPMAVVAIFPAAVIGGRLFGSRARASSGRRFQAWTWAAARGIVLATFLLGVRSVRTHYANQGPAPLRVMPAQMFEFVDWIRTEVPEEGRLGFAGRTVHFYGGGNTAYLPILTGREMMADDYYGFPRGTIEYNYPPGYYRRSLAGYLFFSRAYGITHWTASDRGAKAFLANNPDAFELVLPMRMLGRDIMTYRVREPGPVSRFLEGEGRVQARENRIEVFPADPAADRVVLRYNWREGLRCRTPGASIEPYAVDQNLRFIAVHPGGNERVLITYRPHRAPVQPNFDGHFHH